MKPINISDQIYPLIVTVALIVALVVLMIYHILTPDNALVTTVFGAIVTYWVVSGASSRTSNQINSALTSMQQSPVQPAQTIYPHSQQAQQ